MQYISTAQKQVIQIALVALLLIGRAARRSGFGMIGNTNPALRTVLTGFIHDYWFVIGN